MYRINLQELERTKNTYQEAAQRMQELGEAAGELSAQASGEAWRGRDAESFAGNMRGWLQHSHVRTTENLAGVGRALSDAWETAADLKRYCESFAGIFTEDAAAPAPGWEPSGILSCDPQMTDRISMHAREACENADRIKRLLDGMDREMAGMGGMGEIHACMEKIRADCNRIERLGDYAAALETYREGVEQLDRSIAKALMPFSGSGAGECAGRYMPAGTEDGVNTQRLLWLLGQGDGILTEEEQEERDNALGLLAAGGDREALLAAAEAILEKEVSAWTEREASYAAWAWAYLVEGQDAEGVERFIRKLQHVEEAAVGKPGQEVTVYVAYFGQEACSVLMENLDAATQGEAYYTLNRLCMYREVSVVPPMPGGMWQFRAGVRLEDGRLEIKLVTGTPGVADWKSTTLTVLDVGSEAGVKGRQVLGKLGFSKQQISALLLSAYTDADVKFVGALCRADSVEEYAEVFLADPGELSGQMAAGLYGYACVLMENGLSEGAGGGRSAAGLGRLETFLNGMLASRRTEMEKREYRTEEGTEWRWEEVTTCHTGEYLEMMVSQGRRALNVTASILYENYSAEQVVSILTPDFNREVSLYALFQSLRYFDEKLQEEDSCHYRMEGLGISWNPEQDALGDGIFWEMKTLWGGWEVPWAPFKDVSVYLAGPEGCEQMKRNEECVEKIRKKEAALPGFFLDKGVFVLEEIFTGLGVINTLYGLPDEVNEIVEAYEEADSAEKGMLDDVFGDGIVVDTGGKETIISRGAYSMNLLLKKIYFYHEGLQLLDTGQEGEGMEDTIRNGDAVIRGMEEAYFAGVDMETRKDMLSIVWCGKPLREGSTLTMKDMTAAQIHECIMLIEGMAGKKRGEWYGELMEYEIMERKTGGE